MQGDTGFSPPFVGSLEYTDPEVRDHRRCVEVGVVSNPRHYSDHTFFSGSGDSGRESPTCWTRLRGGRRTGGVRCRVSSSAGGRSGACRATGSGGSSTPFPTPSTFSLIHGGTTKSGRLVRGGWGATPSQQIASSRTPAVRNPSLRIRIQLTFVKSNTTAKRVT